MIPEPVGRDWRLHAACARPGVDPEWFHPLDTGPAGERAVARAKRVCAGCPVAESCLADVMGTEDPTRRWGVTGGLSADERTQRYARTHHHRRRPVVVLAGVQLDLLTLLDPTDPASGAVVGLGEVA